MTEAVEPVADETVAAPDVEGDPQGDAEAEGEPAAVEG